VAAKATSSGTTRSAGTCTWPRPLARSQPAAVNVGIRPTFESGRGLLVEAYLIDFDGDLYGKTLRIAFIARLRGERRFPGVDELIAQMHRDTDEARELCASFTPP